MKSKELQRIVQCKVLKGKTPSQILNEVEVEEVSLPTIKRWSAQVKRNGSIQLQSSTGRPRTVRSKKNLNKIKKNWEAKKPKSARGLARQIGSSDRSVRRAFKQDFGFFAYKKRKEPALTPQQKLTRKQFSKWTSRNLTQDERQRVVFSDEKYFDIDGVYNSNNDRVWAVSREEADKKGGAVRKNKFPQKVMIWMAACSTGETKLFVVKEKSLEHTLYIQKCLPLAKKLGNKEFRNKWWFQQDGAPAHRHSSTQQWCSRNMPNFFSKDRWPANSPDLNPLDYGLWVELGRNVNWAKVVSKASLITQVKGAFKRMRKNVIVDSCLNWSSRLYKVYTTDGNYIH